MTDDAALLRRYLEGSEDAFAELVRLHIGAVYGTALRQVAGDAHLARDVTQKVFIGLARKARSLAERPVLIGWLYLSTQYEAAKAVRSEKRWRNRDQKAQAMNDILEQGAPEPDWTALRPVIDSAMRNLKEGDRDALLLRFFQSRTLAEVGEVLGLSENAARMRVERALDKLHGQLVRRGIKSTASALGVVLAGQVATAVPASLAVTVTTTALAGAATVTGATLIFMGMTKLQVGIAAALAVVGGSTLWSENRAAAKLQAENSAFVTQTAAITPLKSENARLEAEATKIAAMRQQASGVTALRAEEAQLKRALEKAAADRKARAQAQLLSETADGMPVYAANQLDEAPTVLTRVPPQYPNEMMVLGLAGDALIEFVVKADGSVGAVEVTKTNSEAFGEAARAAAAKWVFKPGQKGGAPVNTRVAVPFVFAVVNDGITDWF